MEARSVIEYYKTCLVRKTVHDLSKEGDLKLTANVKMILKCMWASLENCERMKKGFITGIKTSPNVSSFLDPLLLQEAELRKTKTKQLESSFFQGCIKAGNWVKFQALKVPISQFWLKSVESFAQVSWKFLFSFLHSDRQLHLQNWAREASEISTIARREECGARDLLCFAFDNQIQLQPVLGGGGKRGWRDCGLTSIRGYTRETNPWSHSDPPINRTLQTGPGLLGKKASFITDRLLGCPGYAAATSQCGICAVWLLISLEMLWLNTYCFLMCFQHNPFTCTCISAANIPTRVF